ncbi:MAG: phosphate ABC transporter substrate-binding protein PstS [Thaumarchaeota archaeon]|nr:phosphate ABC transporter substrate-binding protein PstS [Nitrososphaerota archaeon]
MLTSKKIRSRRAISSTILVLGIVTIIAVAGIAGYVALSSSTRQITQTQFVTTTTTQTQTTTQVSTQVSTQTTTQVSISTTTTTQTSASSPAQAVMLNGAGATFPYPLLSTIGSQYNKLNPNVQINYQSIGSGGGIKQLTAKTVDFGASDAPLTAAQRTAAPNTVHIPETIGSVVFAYNLPNIQKGLKFTGPIIADIFLGKITKWNDPAIQSLNPGAQLPDKDILVVHRADGSGTTFVWTSYLSIMSPDWQSKVGRGTVVQWPVGLGSSGNEGVAGLVRGTQYATGYVELAYALQNSMTYAFIQNKAGIFVEPTLNSTKAAVSAMVSATPLPSGDQSWANVTLLNAPGADSYPVASFSYLLVYKELSVVSGMDQAKAKTLIDYLWWVIHDGQKNAPTLQYVPLPNSVVSIDEQTINSITFNGQPLHS